MSSSGLIDARSRLAAPERVDRADVAPVRRRAVGVADAAHRERMRQRAALAHGARDHVLAEVVARLRVGQVFLEQLVEVVGIEDVDAHARQGHVVVTGHRRRVGRLLDEARDLARVVHRHHAESAGLGARHLDAAHGTTGAGLDVVLQHQRVVHLVDVIAGQHHDVLGVRALDDVQVLVTPRRPCRGTSALRRPAAAPAADRPPRSVRRAGSSSRAAGGATANAICTASPRRCGGCRS